jgi:glycosyltransferase involved in cell wall biosynthesis
MFIDKKTKVIVQTPEKDDSDFISSLNNNLIPIQLGSGDWTDAERFSEPENQDKIYDLIMVANWGLAKRHKELFKALSKVSRPLKVVLVGFPWENRTKEDIVNEFNYYVGKKSKDIELICKEKIPHHEVTQILCETKCSLLLSKKEGFNKGIMESLFCNVPAIVYDKHRGGAQEKINSKTGILSSYEELHNSIEYMLDHYKEFSPRKFVLKTSGSKYSTNKLNELLKSTTLYTGGTWVNDIVEKVNNPFFEYKDSNQKTLYSSDYEFIKQCLL